MTCGIYRLIFDGTNKCYIGQSVNIEKRYLEHLRSFVLGTASKKMLLAYSAYGKPGLDILLDNIEKLELDTLENEAIEIYDSYHNGFNSVESADDTPRFSGCHNSHSNAAYTNTQLFEALCLLSERGLLLADIEEITGVLISTLTCITKGTMHRWLQDEHPQEYAKLSSINRNAYYYKRSAVPKVISPEGNIFEVPHLRNFSKTHNLHNGALSRVISGKASHHKGWKIYE